MNPTQSSIRHDANPSKHGQDDPQRDKDDLPRGDTDENPRGIGFFALVGEDFRTHDRNPFEPGFWALATHRFGNWRMGVRPRLLRAPFTVGYRLAHTWVNWLWGIDLGYTVKVGRRVRLWHHGGMVLSARAIGDDVHIRHNTTMGIARRSELTKKPTIESGVDIGVGACILGDVTVGHDSVIGANAVVVTTFPPHSKIAGVPARALGKASRGEDGSNGKRATREISTAGEITNATPNATATPTPTARF